MEISLSVRRKEAEMIVPAGPTPEERKQLSGIDTQKELWQHFSVIMFYQSNALMERDGKDPVKVIREAVAKVLVYYYPYAGKLLKLEDHHHHYNLLVDCNTQGVVFVEADANLKLNDLGDSIRPPCPYSYDLLYNVPISAGIFGCPILLIQVTRFKCGGFAIGVRMCHVVSDGLGLAQFFNAVGEIARGAIAPSILPVWGRGLVFARNPPNVSCKHPEYEEVDQDPLVTMNNEDLAQRSFFFGPTVVRAIRKHVSIHCSTFDTITACVWKLRTKALQVDPDQVVRLTSVMSVRSKKHLDLPVGFYGNALASPAAVSKAGDLCKNSLAYALGLIKEAKARVNEEFMRSLIDLMVVEGGPPLAKSWNFIVSDLSRLGFEEVDCGWGKAVYGGPAAGGTSSFCWSTYAKFRKTNGEAGIVVPIWLPFPAMERFEEELKTLMQPVNITSML